MLPVFAIAHVSAHAYYIQFPYSLDDPAGLGNKTQQSNQSITFFAMLFHFQIHPNGTSMSHEPYVAVNILSVHIKWRLRCAFFFSPTLFLESFKTGLLYMAGTVIVTLCGE